MWTMSSECRALLRNLWNVATTELSEQTKEFFNNFEAAMMWSDSTRWCDVVRDFTGEWRYDGLRQFEQTGENQVE